VEVFCSKELGCRRAYLLRYLETGASSLPPSDTVIPFDNCCDACDIRLDRGACRETKTIAAPEVTVNKLTRAAQVVSPEQQKMETVTVAHSAQIEKALKVTRFDLCQQLGETVPYRLVSSEELKTLSLHTPPTLRDLLDPPFLWSEKRAQMIGEPLVRCINEYLTTHRLQRREQSVPVPLPPLPLSRTLHSPPKDLLPPPRPSCPPLALEGSFQEEGRILPQRSIPQPSPALPSAVTMKRRRSEAVNASCGVGTPAPS
jgi:hypothetical protein